jgi:hypothetical protein
MSEQNLKDFNSDAEGYTGRHIQLHATSYIAAFAAVTATAHREFARHWQAC